MLSSYHTLQIYSTQTVEQHTALVNTHCQPNAKSDYQKKKKSAFISQLKYISGLNEKDFKLVS